MVLTQNIARSTRHIGKHEEKIILSLVKYFQFDGYQATPHSRLNIAWGSIISDVDLLLLKDRALTYVEVKSSKDNLKKGVQQTERLMDYVDYAWVATDKNVTNWNVPNIGLIHVQEDDVTFKKKAKKFSTKPRLSSLVALRKKCLARFFGKDVDHLMLVNKYELAQQVYVSKREKCTRACLKEIVTCGGSCDTYCPILQTENATSLV